VYASESGGKRVFSSHLHLNGGVVVAQKRDRERERERDEERGRGSGACEDVSVNALRACRKRGRKLYGRRREELRSGASSRRHLMKSLRNWLAFWNPHLLFIAKGPARLCRFGDFLF